MLSVPWYAYPAARSCSPKKSTARCCSENWKGVASCRMPCSAPALPAIDSRSMPIVMREGKPCGLKRMSGERPDSQKGMSSAAHSRDRTPFCPCRDENLSPGTGFRISRNLMKTRGSGALAFVGSPPTSRTSSTIAVSALLYSFTVCLPVTSSRMTHRGSSSLSRWPTSGSPSGPRRLSKGRPLSVLATSWGTTLEKRKRGFSPRRCRWFRSIVLVRRTEPWQKPRSYDALLMIIASSMS
mmetsp:Transcript_24694/g.57512  ORF Transcript_24694/g.57512 Transcript_24694/m.57512 type:complete len:240 (-) Transcript_24694:2324-3043(-)